MRATLPRKPKRNESAIINLDSVESAGTHWVAYVKKGNVIKYFDSFGNLRPPMEVIRYFNKNPKTIITYNYERLQHYNSAICGQLCVRFLMKHA